MSLWYDRLFSHVVTISVRLLRSMMLILHSLFAQANFRIYTNNGLQQLCTIGEQTVCSIRLVDTAWRIVCLWNKVGHFQYFSSEFTVHLHKSKPCCCVCMQLSCINQTTLVDSHLRMICWKLTYLHLNLMKISCKLRTIRCEKFSKFRSSTMWLYSAESSLGSSSENLFSYGNYLVPVGI